MISLETLSTGPHSKVSILPPDNRERIEYEARQKVFDEKIKLTNDKLIDRFKRFEGINIDRAGKKRWYLPLGQTDVTKFADAYTKTMISGLYAKNQLLVSR